MITIQFTVAEAADALVAACQLEAELVCQLKMATKAKRGADARDTRVRMHRAQGIIDIIERSIQQSITQGAP